MEETTYAALYQGIWTDRSLMAKLARRQRNTLLEFMDKVEEFINQEETLRAIIRSRQPQFSIPKISKNKKKKKKNPKVEDTIDFKPCMTFKEYNFTPLNVAITKVLMQIKKDPEFALPPKIWEIHQRKLKIDIALSMKPMATIIRVV